MADTVVKHEGGQAAVVRTVTTRTETEHVAVVTLERKDDLHAGTALTTTAGSGALTTTVPSISTGGGGGGGASHRETSQTRESHRTTTSASSGGGGGGNIGAPPHYAPITGPVTSSSSAASQHVSSSRGISTVPTATLAAAELQTSATVAQQLIATAKPPTIEKESYTMVKTKTKAAPKVVSESSSSKFITTSGGGGGGTLGGYTADTEHTAERHHTHTTMPQVAHHEHYQHHAASTATTGGSAHIERKIPMTTTSSSTEKKTFQQYSKKSRAEGVGSGHETDTDTEDEKRRTASSSRTGYHSATEQNYASHKHHHVHANYDNDYHDRKKRELKMRVLRNQARRRMAIRRWCRCDSVCFLLILAVLHILVGSTIIGLNISAWIVSGMWLIKVIDFLFWVFALGFLAFLTGVVGVIITYKLRSPYSGGSGVNRSRTINTLRGSHLQSEYNTKEEERLSSHAVGSHSGGHIANDHLNNDLSGGLNDLEETETSYGDIPAQRRKHRIHYALLFLLCIIVIVLAIVAYLLITYDYHEPIAQRRDNNRDYSVFEDTRRPQEATYSKYFTYLYNRVNTVSEEEQIDQAYTLNTLRSLLITFVALELGLAVITLGLAFVYLFRGYRLHCPCLVSDSHSNDIGMSNGGAQPVIVSPSQMTLGSRGGAGLVGGTLSGYGHAGGQHVVREFDREERETVRLVA